MENYVAMEMDRRQVNAISALGLAHMGDGVFELLVWQKKFKVKK